MSSSNIERFPLVSIIIPNYNHSQFIGGAIESALNQIYPKKEIIVIDDGSTDNCWEVVANFGDRVRYIWQENRGLAGARNTGIRASTGDLIGLLDADDQWEPDYLEHMVRIAEQHPEAAVFYCQTRCMDVAGLNLPQVLGGPPILPESTYWALIRSNFIIPSTVLLRKSMICDAGLFDQNLKSCEDWDLWLRLLPEKTIIGSPSCLGRYRIHGNSLSTNIEGMHSAARAVIENHFGPEDGQYHLWSAEKRRAYGGLYWYYAWTTLVRLNQWELAGTYIHKAIDADPNLAAEIDFFYEIALGDQPTGYRGTSQKLDIKSNVIQIEKILQKLVHDSSNFGNESRRSILLSTAFFSFGILAYNTGKFDICRSYLTRALRYRRSLITNRRFVRLYLRSLLGTRIIKRIRNIRAENKLTV